MYKSEEEFMKYIKQLSIIIFISFLGELLKALVLFPIPASIYGLILLFLALQAKLIRLEAVKETGSFLVGIMPIMFIPAATGLISVWPTLQMMLFPIIIVTAIGTAIVMIISGRCVQWAIRRKNKSI